MTARILAGAMALAICTALPADAKSKAETAGTAVAVALPVLAGGVTLYKRDWQGTAQFMVTTLLTVGTVYGMKQFIHVCRPFAKPCAPGSDNWDSFPSDTSALAFSPAQFLWQRYGWEYGLPAYGAAAFVGWSRVHAKKHRWTDVMASAGIAFVYNEIFTTEYYPPIGFYTNVDGGADGAYAQIGYRF